MEAGQGSAFAQLIPLILLFAIFYFLIIRPQNNERKRHREMLDALKKGDEIVTSGGLYAEIVKVEEEFIKIKLNDSSIVKLDKNFVARKIEFSNEAA